MTTQLDVIVKVVCAKFNVDESLISIKLKKRPPMDVSIARQVICYLNKK